MADGQSAATPPEGGQGARPKTQQRHARGRPRGGQSPRSSTHSQTQLPPQKDPKTWKNNHPIIWTYSVDHVPEFNAPDPDLHVPGFGRTPANQVTVNSELLFSWLGIRALHYFNFLLLHTLFLELTLDEFGFITSGESIMDLLLKPPDTLTRKFGSIGQALVLLQTAWDAMEDFRGFQELGPPRLSLIKLIRKKVLEISTRRNQLQPRLWTACKPEHPS